MAEVFKKGDVVRLKSGGPDMSVEMISKDQVMCTWFNGKKTESQEFDQAVLEKVEPKK